MDKIKIGIIGVGYIAGVHAAILSTDERVALTAVHDVVNERAKVFAAAHGAWVAGTPDEVIDRCDAVYITTPNTKHVSLAMAAADAGKHVFCDKPMATTIADAEAVLKKAKSGRGVFQVGHNRRFAPVYAILKRMISESHDPHSVHVKMNRGELLKPGWVGDSLITGGFLYETTIHMFDMMRFLFGDIVTLHALGSTHEYDETDDFSVLLKFRTGLHATMASSADASWLFPFERIEVFCHHATIVTREMESLVLSNSIEGQHTEHSMHRLSREEKWGYRQENLAFIDSIINGSGPLVTALDGFKSVELVNACYEAVNSGLPISISS